MSTRAPDRSDQEPQGSSDHGLAGPDPLPWLFRASSTVCVTFRRQENGKRSLARMLSKAWKTDRERGQPLLGHAAAFKCHLCLHCHYPAFQRSLLSGCSADRPETQAAPRQCVTFHVRWHSVYDGVQTGSRSLKQTEPLARIQARTKPLLQGEGKASGTQGQERLCMLRCSHLALHLSAPSPGPHSQFCAPKISPLMRSSHRQRSLGFLHLLAHWHIS